MHFLAGLNVDRETALKTWERRNGDNFGGFEQVRDVSRWTKFCKLTCVWRYLLIFHSINLLWRIWTIGNLIKFLLFNIELYKWIPHFQISVGSAHLCCFRKKPHDSEVIGDSGSVTQILLLEEVKAYWVRWIQWGVWVQLYPEITLGTVFPSFAFQHQGFMLFFLSFSY